MSPQTSGVEFSRVIRFLERRYPGFAETAYGEFIAHVDPDFNGLSYEHAERLHELALEWAIFDRTEAAACPGSQRAIARQRVIARRRAIARCCMASC